MRAPASLPGARSGSQTACSFVLALTTSQSAERFVTPLAKQNVILQLHNAKEYCAPTYLNFNAVARRSRFVVRSCRFCSLVSSRVLRGAAKRLQLAQSLAQIALGFAEARSL